MNDRRNNDTHDSCDARDGMDCRFWAGILEDYLSDSLEQTQRERADRHLEQCARCRELLAVARGTSDILSADEADDLTGSILAATSGSPCTRAGGLLPDLVDGALSHDDTQLVRMHLEHCRRCRTVSETLIWLGPVLAGMSRLDPGSDFTAAVLRQTSRRSPERSGAWRHVRNGARAGSHAGARARAWTRNARTVADRWIRWWHAQIQRPRFALEAAYVATVLVLGLVATPVSPLREAPQKALVVVRSGPCEIEPLCEVLRTTQRLAVDIGEYAVGGPARKVDGMFASIRFDLRQRRTRVAPVITDLSTHGAVLKTSLGQGQFQAAGQAARLLGEDVQNLWRQWWRDPSVAEPDST